MGGPTLIQLVAWAATGVCVLGALWLLWFARFRDKDRGKARCPKCWYELGRLDSPPALPVTCPECGGKIETLRQLQRRCLRRWPVLVALPLLLAAWVCWELPRIDQRGWLWLVPNRVLFEMYPIGKPQDDFQQQVHMRLGRSSWPGGFDLRTLDEADLAALISRSARGNTLAPRLSEKWKQTYGVLLRSVLTSDAPLPESPARLASLGPPSESLVAAMEEVANLPCDFSITTRDVWPTAVVSRQLIGVQLSSIWWPQYWKIEGAIEWTATNERGERAQGTGTYEHMQSKIDVPLEGNVSVDATIKLFKLPPPGVAGEKRLLIAHPFQWKYRTVPSVEAAYTPVVDTRIDEALTRVRVYTRGASLAIDATPLGDAGVADVTFAARLTLRAGERIVGTGKAVWIGSAKRMNLYGPGGLDETAPEPASLMAGIVPPGLTLTLTSDPSLAIQTQSTDRLWTGEVTFPLKPGPVVDPYAPANQPPVSK